MAICSYVFGLLYKSNQVFVCFYAHLDRLIPSLSPDMYCSTDSSWLNTMSSVRTRLRLVVAIASLSPDPYNVLQFFMAKYVEFYGDAASVGGGNQGLGL